MAIKRRRVARAPGRRYRRRAQGPIPQSDVRRLMRYAKRADGDAFAMSNYSGKIQKRSAATYENYGPSWNTASLQQQANRLNDGYIGRGGYLSGMKNIWKKIPEPIRDALVEVGVDEGRKVIMGRGSYSSGKPKLAVMPPGWRNTTPKHRFLGRGSYLSGIKKGLGKIGAAIKPHLRGKDAWAIDLVEGIPDRARSNRKDDSPYAGSNIGIARPTLAPRLWQGSNWVNSDFSRNLMSNLSGRGAYSTGSKNNLFLDGDYAPEAAFSSAGDETGALTITHKEYIGDVFGNSLDGGNPIPFVNKEYSLNPGLEGTFPWLAQISANFEEYEMKQLVFEYRSTLADVSSTNGEIGSIVTATNYNASRPPFDNKQTMMQYAHAHTTKSTMNNIHGVECQPSKISGSEGKYIRTGRVPDGEDVKTYDHGTFQIAVCGTPSVLADLPIGELWVSYRVLLRKPKLFTGQGLAISKYVVQNGPYDALVSAGTHPLGDITSSTHYPMVSTHNSLPCTLLSNATDGTTITLPSNFAGDLELRIAVELNPNGTHDWYRLQAPALGGNIAAQYDITHAVGDEMSDPRPAGDLTNLINPFVSVQGSVEAKIGLTLIAHYRVQPETGGVPNTLSWGTLEGQDWEHNGSLGNIIIWKNSTPASSAFKWDTVKTGVGNALGAGELDGITVTLQEYNSPLSHQTSSTPTFERLT